MKHSLYFAIVCCLLLFQCKEKKEPITPASLEKVIPLSLSIPGVNPENIMITDDHIVINLPEDYTEGDFIKPIFKISKEYTIESDLLAGFSYNQKSLELRLESNQLNPIQYKIMVIPFKPVKLEDPLKNYNITLGPEANIAIPVSITGTLETLGDSGQIVNNPTLSLINRKTGSVLNISAHFNYSAKTFEVQFPATTPLHDYTANIVWGGKTELLSQQITIRPGIASLRAGSWNILPESRNFTINGYNISQDSQFELVMENDYYQSKKIPLVYKDAATLTGTIPKEIPNGNYRATYMVNGQKIKTLDFEWSGQKYITSDHIYVRSQPAQPIIKNVSQQSGLRSFQSDWGHFYYFQEMDEISKEQNLLTYIDRGSGTFPDKHDLILVHTSTRTEYTLTYTPDQNVGLFDGFVVMLSYKIPKDLPVGNYEVYAIFGPNEDKSEKYSQIIKIK